MKFFSAALVAAIGVSACDARGQANLLRGGLLKPEATPKQVGNSSQPSALPYGFGNSSHAGFAASHHLPANPAQCEIPFGMRSVTVEPTYGNPFSMVVFAQGMDIVSDHIAASGGWEMRHLNEFATKAKTQMPADAVLLDIGANLGYFTFLFANEGHHVIAVEPMTRNRKAMEATLCLNPHMRPLVTVVPAALASPEQVQAAGCVVRSTNTAMNNGNGYLKCGSDIKPCAPDEGGGCEMVALKTLDTALAEVAPAKVDVLKMDVEAFECNILAGGQTLFTKYHPHILNVETEYCCKTPNNCVDQAAQTYGYCKVPLGTNTALHRVTDPSLYNQLCA